MIALVPLLAVLLLSWRYPGAALAGLFFGFPATLVARVDGVTPAFTAAAAVILLLRHGRHLGAVKLSMIDAAMTGVVFVITLSTLWSPAASPLSVWIALIQPLLGVYIIAKLAVSYGNSDERLQEFVVAFAILGMIYAVLMALVADTTGARLKLEDQGNVAVGLTQAFVISSICGLTLLLGRGRLMVRMLGLAAICLPFYGIMLTGTRGAFLAVVAGFSALVYMTYGVKRLAVSAAALIPVLFITVNLLPARFLLFLPEFRIFRFNTYGSGTDASSLQRIWRFDAAKEFIAEAPLLGKGLGSYSALTTYGYPHNFFLDVWVQMGLLGLIAVCALGVVTLLHIRGLGLSRMSKASIALCAILFAGFVHQQVSFSLSQGKPLFLVGAVSGVTLASLSIPRRRSIIPRFKIRRSGLATRG